MDGVEFTQTPLWPKPWQRRIDPTATAGAPACAVADGGGASYRAPMRVLALLSLLFVSAVHADVYRWTDSSGVVHYADKPLVPEAKAAALPALQTYQAGSPPPLIGAADTQAVSAIIINSPKSGEVVRDANGQMTIEVAAAPTLGEGIIYYLDGVAQNKTPTPSTALLLSASKPGSHSVSAALVDAGGHEVARAAPVKIYVKPAQN